MLRVFFQEDVLFKFLKVLRFQSFENVLQTMYLMFSIWLVQQKCIISVLLASRCSDKALAHRGQVRTVHAGTVGTLRRVRILKRARQGFRCPQNRDLEYCTVHLSAKYDPPPSPPPTLLGGSG